MTTEKTPNLPDLPLEQMLVMKPSQIRVYFFDRKIPKDYLLEIIKQCQATNVVDNRLGSIYIILTEKLMYSQTYSGYSDVWKDEMRHRAQLHLCSYGLNFDPAKTKKDPASYFYKIISSAFHQAIKKLKTKAELQNPTEQIEEPPLEE